MTIKQAILYAFLYVGIIVLGLYIGIAIAGYYNGSLVSVSAFVMVSFGVMGLSISLARLSVPVVTDFGVSTLLSGKQYQQFRQSVGKAKARTINTIYISLFFILFSFTAFLYARFNQAYEYNQLSKYGKTLKVKITANEYAPNARQYGLFDYTVDNNRYHEKLPTLLYKGDSAWIIVSTRHPKLVKWLSDYQKEAEAK